jgi:hypothetical protein
MNAPVQSFDSVCDAIREVHDEASLWRLSDELVKVAPYGVDAVKRVVVEAKSRGIPSKSVNTLRLYRDVAARFPAADRVPLVSFSAHREAIAVGDATEARRILLELSAKHGPEGVTVATVKAAIGAATGKVTPVRGGSSSTGVTAATVQSLSYAEFGADLSNGGKKFLAHLDGMLSVPNVSLDGLHAGLSTVLAEVESRRGKAARKAARGKAPAPTSAGPRQRPAPSGKAGQAAAGSAGDLRDL